MTLPGHMPCRSLGSLTCNCFINTHPLDCRSRGYWTARWGGPTLVLRLTVLISEQLWQLPPLLPCPWSPHVNLSFSREGAVTSRLISISVTQQKWEIWWRWSTQTLAFHSFCSLLLLLSFTLDFSEDATFKVCDLSSAEQALLSTGTWGELL